MKRRPCPTVPARPIRSADRRRWSAAPNRTRRLGSPQARCRRSLAAIITSLLRRKMKSSSGRPLVTCAWSLPHRAARSDSSAGLLSRDVDGAVIHLQAARPRQLNRLQPLPGCPDSGLRSPREACQIAPCTESAMKSAAERSSMDMPFGEASPGGATARSRGRSGTIRQFPLGCRRQTRSRSRWCRRGCGERPSSEPCASREHRRHVRRRAQRSQNDDVAFVIT